MGQELVVLTIIDFPLTFMKILMLKLVSYYLFASIISNMLSSVIASILIYNKLLYIYCICVYRQVRVKY